MIHIGVPAIQNKLKHAEQSFRSVMILASAGWGKTSAVKYYFRKKSMLYLSGATGRLDAMPDPSSVRQGAAAKPAVSEAYRRTVIEQAREIALYYPNYLKYTPKITVSLTAREQEILGLLCAGKSMEEICSYCGISYSGLKKHNRNIYAKLGVKNRAEAERAAAHLGISHRKNSV